MSADTSGLRARQTRRPRIMPRCCHRRVGSVTPSYQLLPAITIRPKQTSRVTLEGRLVADLPVAIQSCLAPTRTCAEHPPDREGAGLPGPGSPMGISWAVFRALNRTLCLSASAPLHASRLKMKDLGSWSVFEWTAPRPESPDFDAQKRPLPRRVMPINRPLRKTPCPLIAPYGKGDAH